MRGWRNYIGRERIGVYAEMRISQDLGSDTRRSRTMTKNLALAASVVMLMATSGQAFASSTAVNRYDRSEAIVRADRQAVDVFNAFDPAMATQTAEPDAYRYHGGPKFND
jgi:hypothetical protein